MIGYTDPFTSIDDPRDETYVIFDNVRVEPILAPWSSTRPTTPAAPPMARPASSRP